MRFYLHIPIFLVFTLSLTNSYGQRDKQVFQDPLRPTFEVCRVKGKLYFNYLTSNQFSLPSILGSSGTYLQSNGDGTTSWAAASGTIESDTTKVDKGGDVMWGTLFANAGIQALNNIEVYGSLTRLGFSDPSSQKQIYFTSGSSISNSQLYRVPTNYPASTGYLMSCSIANGEYTLGWSAPSDLTYPADSNGWVRNKTSGYTNLRWADKVGIGTQTPTQKLHVDGSFKLTTNFFWEHSSGSVGNLYRGSDLWMHDNKSGIFIGTGTTATNLTGTYNVVIGDYGGNSITSGASNTFIGSFAGRYCAEGSRNVFIGYKAGYRETGSDLFIVDNREREDENDSRYKSLLYGIFSDETTGQSLRVNGYLDWSSQPSYPHVIVADTERDIPNNTMAIWNDTANSRIYLLVDVQGTQYKVLLQ